MQSSKRNKKKKKTKLFLIINAFKHLNPEKNKSWKGGKERHSIYTQKGSYLFVLSLASQSSPPNALQSIS